MLTITQNSWSVSAAGFIFVKILRLMYNSCARRRFSGGSEDLVFAMCICLLLHYWVHHISVILRLAWQCDVEYVLFVELLEFCGCVLSSKSIAWYRKSPAFFEDNWQPYRALLVWLICGPISLIEKIFHAYGLNAAVFVTKITEPDNWIYS